MSAVSAATIDRIKDLVKKDIEPGGPNTTGAPDEFWQQLRATGTELWLDTGDIDAAAELWTAEMTALTTNNTLLNKEIQKGIYDGFVREAAAILGDLDRRQKISEIGFILNARHGLRLVETFGGDVSVELHTDLADDLDGIVHYGRRFHDIEPDHFIVKVPLTATGLLGARKLREEGIRINFTLEFSARQNAVVAAAAMPNYCNVFLGRLNAYVKDNGLGTGVNVGEKATIASQNVVREMTAGRRVPTKQIAASLRSGDQVEKLAGVDVFTMPTSVAQEARETLQPDFASKLGTTYEVELNPDVTESQVHIEKLWDVDETVRTFAQSLEEDTPESGDELAARARDMGLGDMFPQLTGADLERIAKDGKIPKHEHWKDRIEAGELAVDTLLNLAGLASFTRDQKALDDRIAGLI
ncbi:MAG: transaldolase family protein [Spirochaetaceae bacterium]